MPASKTVRVFLLCYNRNEMLPRAIESLVRQTHTNWSCELHCDKPDNHFPCQYLKELNDKRFTLHQHKKNLGLTEAFNVPFADVPDNFISILEEDNWWEPTFLAEMIEALDKEPECDVAWCNMRIWNLNEKGWVNTQTTIWELPDETNRKFSFPHVQQIASALHSQGSMLVRANQSLHHLKTPFDFDSGAMEAIRERAMTSPLLFVNKVLGNYAMLEESHRSKKPVVWSTVQLCLLTSFFEKVEIEPTLLRKLLARAREGKAKSIQIYILSWLLMPKTSLSLKCFTASDFFFFTAFYTKHVGELVKTLQRYRQLKELRAWLSANTRQGELKDVHYESCQ